MSFPSKALAMSAAGAGLIVIIMRLLAPTEPPAAVPAPQTAATPAGAAPVAATTGSDEADPTPDPGNLVSYAVVLNELHGLPSRVAAGTVLDLWVAWEPPVTKKPKIHRLLRNVILEEIAPPLLPDGPHTALLLVRPGQLSDLLYGDRYGSLSVAIPQG